MINAASNEGIAGRTFIVTGASSGIGESAARILAERGANVALVGRSQAKLAETIERIGGDRGNCLGIEADLAGSDSPGRIVEATVGAFGGIDGLVHNAATIGVEAIEDLTPESADEQWRVNVSAPMFLTKEALPYLDSGSSIVFVSSTCVNVGMGNIGIYTATKGALAAVARSMADEFSPRGIRVNVVSPGWIKTPAVEPQFEANPGFEDLIVSRSLVGRIGHPDDIGNLITYLLSPEAGYVNGATMVADGGASASMNLR